MYAENRGSARRISLAHHRFRADTLLAWMTASEPEFRDFTSWLLVRLRDADSLPGLVDLLAQSDEGVRRSAMMTLVRYGRRARPTLLSAANCDDPRVRDSAKSVLDMIEGRQPIPVGSTSRSPLWFAEAARGQMQSWRAVPVLIGALDDPEPTMREIAAFAIGAYDHPDVVPALIESVNRQNDHGRATVAQALGRRADPVAVPLLLDLLRDRSDMVCEHAAIALGRFAHNEMVETLLGRLDDDDPKVRCWSAFALGEMSDFSVGQVLDELERASEDRLPHLVHAALHARSERAVPKLVSLLFDGECDYDLRVDIATEFKEFDARQVLDALRQIAARDPNSLLGRVAQNSAYWVGGKKPRDRPSRKGWSEPIHEQAHQAHRRYVGRIGNVRPRSWLFTYEDYPLPMQKIRSVDPLVRRDGFLELAYSDMHVETSSLLGDLRGRTSSGQVHAINAGLLHIPIMYFPMLMETVRSQDPVVRRATADALVQIGEASVAMTFAWIDAHWFGHQYVDARNPDQIETFYVPRLIDLLNDRSALLRRSAAQALAEVRSARSLNELRERAADRAITVRLAARRALAALRAKEDPRYALRLYAVHGGGAFEEIGAPYGIDWNRDRSLVAVMSGLPDNAWNQQDPNDVGHYTRVAVYDTKSLACRATFESYQIRSVDFHPSEPILAIGAGGYDGGSAFQGHLYIWNYDENVAANVFERRETGRFFGCPEICRVRFSPSGRTLTLTARYVQDYKVRPENASLEQVDLSVDQWRHVRNGQYLWRELEQRPVEADENIPNWNRTTVDPATIEQLGKLAAGAGRRFEPRWSIWGVGWDLSGNVIALHRDDLEVWSAHGKKTTIYTADLPAVQLHITGGQTLAWINTREDPRPTDGECRSQIVRIDLVTGESSVIDLHDTSYVLQVVDDRWLVGEEYAERYRLPKRTVSIDRAGAVKRGLLDADTPRTMGHLDCRRAASALQIRSHGYGVRPRTPWVTQIASSSLEFEWRFPSAPTGWPVRGYCGLDEVGTYIVSVTHSGSLSHHRGLQRVNAVTGEVTWSRSVYASIDLIEPLHEFGVTVFAGSRHIGLVDNRDGAIIDYQPVFVGNHPTTILSMSSAGNQVACGTADGRVLVYSIDDLALGS